MKRKCSAWVSLVTGFNVQVLDHRGISSYLKCTCDIISEHLLKCMCIWYHIRTPFEMYMHVISYRNTLHWNVPVCDIISNTSHWNVPVISYQTPYIEMYMYVISYQTPYIEMYMHVISYQTPYIEMYMYVISYQTPYIEMYMHVISYQTPYIEMYVYVISYQNTSLKCTCMWYHIRTRTLHWNVRVCDIISEHLTLKCTCMWYHIRTPYIEMYMYVISYRTPVIQG